jgi:hypothetical protein
MAIDVAPADVQIAVGAPMSYWRTVAWRLRRDPATLGAGILLLAIVRPDGRLHPPPAGAHRRARAPARHR